MDNLQNEDSTANLMQYLWGVNETTNVGEPVKQYEEEKIAF